MRLQAYDDNGTMKFRQVSGSQALDSLPVGTTIGYEGRVIPNGYLFCDGSTFDVTKYPELYTLLGTDTLPELFDHSKPSDYETFTGNTASAQYDGEISAVGATGDSAQVSIRVLINGETVMLGGNQFVGCGAISFKKGDTISYSSLRTTPIFYVRYYKQHLLIKAATIGIADISINAIKSTLNDWVDITSDFTITEFNWSNSTTKILYNDMLKKLKVKTTSASAASDTAAHGVKITYNGSDPNISFGDNVIIYGSTNYSANVAVAGYEPQISIISASELQLYGHNRNAISAWPAGASLVFIVEM